MRLTFARPLLLAVLLFAALLTPALAPEAFAPEAFAQEAYAQGAAPPSDLPPAAEAVQETLGPQAQGKADPAATPEAQPTKAIPPAGAIEPEPNFVTVALGSITGWIFKILFFDVLFGYGMGGASLPFVVFLLGAGGVFFTVFHGFINLRGFTHAIDIVRGKYTSPTDDGDVTPFRALTSALSATVGLGNIAGVALAVKTGGPGAVFWMMFLGLFGMTAKFHESTLAQLYRTKNPDGTVSGGAMYYLSRGLGEKGGVYAPLGKVLAVVFALFCIGGALGGGNMFQANQSFEGFFSTFVSPDSETIAEKNRQTINPESLRASLTEKQLRALMTKPERAELTRLDEADQTLAYARERAEVDAERIRAIALPSQIESLLPAQDVKAANEARASLKTKVSWGYGLLLSAIVAVVVVGGISRIGAATSRIVPSMCVIYVLGCLTIILTNLSHLPQILGLIFTEAFAFDSLWGGLIGVMVIGFTRAAFSSEAGLGSSAIAHSAAKQREPVREGLVACLEPFIDTIVICFMTAMAVLVTDAYLAPELAEEANGARVTLFAFSQVGVLSGWFPAVLTISIILFAFSTMISWCYYGERAWMYLFGNKTLILFRAVFVVCVFIGATQSLSVVIDFSDAMLLSMALPNILGGILLAPLVKSKLDDYWKRYKTGEMATEKHAANTHD